MHQSRDGRRALHRIGQPDKKRELRAFSNASAEDSNPRNKQKPAAHPHAPPIVETAGQFAGGVLRASSVVDGYLGHFSGSRKLHHAVWHPQRMTAFGGPHEAQESLPHGRRTIWGPFGAVGKMERAKRPPQGHQADEHAKVADAIDDEGFVGGVGSAGALVVEADQKPRANADQLPENEDHCQIAGNQYPQHRKTKEGEGLKEPRKPAWAVQVFAAGQMHFMVCDIVQLVVHVACRIDVDTCGDTRHHHKHQHRQGIDVPTDRKLEISTVVERVPIA